MSAGISPSGVASLRAKFEQKDESTSPPSRGRSPAASLSLTGDASRPISKVRTSFIAVERSGQMEDSNASKELSNKTDVENGDEVEGNALTGAVERPRTNGMESTPQKSAVKEESTPSQATAQSPPTKKDSTPQTNSTDDVPSTTNPDKINSAAEDHTTAILPPDSKDVAAVSSGAALDGATSPLGSILKGSPFEQEEKNNEGANAAAVEPTQSSERQVDAPSSPMTNGKPKGPLTHTPRPPARSKGPLRPSAVGKNPAVQSTFLNTGKSKNKPQTSTLPAPITPPKTTTLTKQQVSKKFSPKSAASKEQKKEVPKEARKTAVEVASPVSVAPKAHATISRPALKPGKKPDPASPSSFTKPRPKSPTRPVRLPSSATAPTAASTAKIDAAPAVTAKPGDRVPSNPTSLRQKSVRSSLPAGSKPTERAKEKPKSRLSTASSKAPEGSFLDRMMRPTQSSSQKTHEKVEVKTPPKKSNGIRPRRKSDGSEKAKNEIVETKREPPTVSAPSLPVQAPADSSEAPTTNGAKSGIDEIPPTPAAPVPS